MTPLEAIHRQFAEPIVYTRKVGGPPLSITAVPSFEAGQNFEGAGKTVRMVTFEVRYTDLAERPTKRDAIVHAGKTYAVNDIVDRDDVGAWELTVEKSA